MPHPTTANTSCHAPELNPICEGYPTTQNYPRLLLTCYSIYQLHLNLFSLDILGAFPAPARKGRNLNTDGRLAKIATRPSCSPGARPPEVKAMDFPATERRSYNELD